MTISEYRYFNLSEFECSCCQENDIKPEFVAQLDRARAIAGIPFKINSGYRCEEHNRKVGGVSTSSHIKGYAADIHCLTSSARHKIIEALMSVGFDRIGITENFIHVDSDPIKPSSLIWLY